MSSDNCAELLKSHTDSEGIEHFFFGEKKDILQFLSIKPIHYFHRPSTFKENIDYM